MEKYSKEANLTINSNNLVFTKISPFVRELLINYSKGLISYERSKRGKRFLLVKKNVFAASTIDRKEFRFHINQKDELLGYLKNSGYGEDKLNIVKKEVPVGLDVDYRIKDNRTPYDYQRSLIDYVANKGGVKVLTLPTGDGKTFVSLKGVARIGKRLMIVILGRYVDKWINDANSAFYLEKDDLMVIRGSKNMISMMNHALDDTLKAKIIICTSNTMLNYIKDYETKGGRGYPIPPECLYEKLNVGVKLIDECHQFFHLNFKMDLYSNIAKSIFLSATLETSDRFLNKMYNIIYPTDVRVQGKKIERFRKVTAISYKIKGSGRLFCERNGSYSHSMFEGHIMNNRSALNSYLNMIFSITNMSFIDDRKRGQKMLIFASTVKMCSLITHFLADKLKGINIARYTAEDPTNCLYENDIVVTTLGSAGTAVDIINLKTCLMTVSIASIQANIQAIGRLRKLKNFPDETPEFIYIYSADIKKQLKYHKAKYDIFQRTAKSHVNHDTNYTLNFNLR